MALGLTRPVLWVNDPSYARLAVSSRWPVLYALTDDWLRAEAPSREIRRRRRQDSELVATAGALTVCSPDLARQYANRRSSALIPNAVDAEHFRWPRERPADLPHGPVAVYVGTLHDERVDVELIERLARHLPDVQIALVGPDSLSLASHQHLRGVPNVHLMGPRPYKDVPAYLQHADVIVVPHIVSPFTESLDPIKAYECLAVSRPTVSTPVAGFRELRGSIRVVEREGFPAEVERLLSENPSTIDPVVLPSWADRADDFADALTAARREGELRVVYLDHTSVLSGGELALVRTIDALDEVRAHVILAEDGPLVERLRGVGASVEIMKLDRVARHTHRDEVVPSKLPLNDLHNLIYNLSVGERLRRLRPDVVHTEFIEGGDVRLSRRQTRSRSCDLALTPRAEDYLPRPAVRLVRFASRSAANGGDRKLGNDVVDAR